MYKATSQRVKKGLLQMVIGRPLSAICGLLVLVFLSRYLSKNDYGLYFTVWAVTELVILASNMGLMNAAYRYISAMELIGGGLVIDGPVWKCVIFRAITLLGISGVVIHFSSYIPAGIIDSITISKYAIYIFLIIVFEGMARYIEIVFDSMLCQGLSQFTLIGRTCLRLIFLLWAVYIHQHIDIDVVLLIECLVTGGGALCGLIFLAYVSFRSRLLAKEKQLNSETQPSDLLRVLNFVVPGYIGQMIALAYSPDMLKLILGGAAGTEALAIFGFAFSLAAVVQRYMPANLLGGVFRPAFVAAFKQDDGGKTLGVVLSLSMKVNLIFILPTIAFCFFGADPLLAKVSGGNYVDVGSVLIILLFWALALSLHLTLAMYCIALEYSRPTLIASAVSTIALPIGIMTAKYGALSIAGVILLSESLWFVVCYLVVRKRNTLQINYFSFFKVILAVFLAIILGFLISRLSLHWLISSIVASISSVFFIYMIDMFDAGERELLNGKFPFLKRWI